MGTLTNVPAYEVDSAGEPRKETIPHSVPLNVYLRTSYRPDREYLDGELLERNVGELPHARLQGFFIKLFGRYEDEWQVEAVPEQRVQVTPARYRVPDICVMRVPVEDTLIVRTPPLLCIEVLSREDSMSEMQERVDDYLAMGVKAVWVVDPWRRKVQVSDKEGVLLPVTDALNVPETAVLVQVPEIFRELDRYAS